MKKKKPVHEKKFIAMPEFPGGNAALKTFIDREVKYPAQALEHKIEGLVHLSYTVSNEGKVEDIVVTRGIGYGCDEEAVRVISQIRYQPAHNRGMKVRSTMKTRIRFKLPDLQAPSGIVYNYITTHKGKQAPKDAGKVVFNYTIVTVKN